jgi:hypothetical protein
MTTEEIAIMRELVEIVRQLDNSVAALASIINSRLIWHKEHDPIKEETI